MVLYSPFRLFHNTGICLAVAQKSVLAELRKRTGYSFINCKKALEQHNNDVIKAEAWMNEEARRQGWVKATRLQGRDASQGLVAIKIEPKDKVATMVEVNCETDFVARNSHFSDLVSAVTSACFSYARSILIKGEQIAKYELSSADIGKLVWEDKTLSDCVAITISRLGENMVLRRAMCVKVGDDIHISGYTHPPTNTRSLMGKYGALVAMKQMDPKCPLHNKVSLEEFGRQLSQHVVGMNPRTLKLNDQASESEEELCIMNQEFLVDPELTVSEVLIEGTVEILSFSRYECGEELPETQSLRQQ